MPEASPSNPQPNPAQPSFSQGISWKNILIGVIIGTVLFGGGGYLAYNAYQFNKEEPTKTTTTAKTTPKSGTITLDSLLEKMKTYENYQLELMTTTPGKRGTNSFNEIILRIGDKQASFNPDLPTIVSYYDFSKKKTYTYDKTSNIYLDDDLKDDISFYQQGNPEYYFRKWPSSLTPRGEEILEGEKVKVYTASSNTISYTAYISSKTGLPLKIVTKTSQGELTFTFKFSRFGEIKESEVTLPATAKKAF